MTRATAGDRRGDPAVSWPRIFVAVLVAVVWAAIMLADAFSTAFEAPDMTSAALGLVAYLFTGEIRKASNGGTK